MRKIRKQKWFAKATALLISALLLVTMLPQAVIAADSDPAEQANMPGVTITEETNAEDVVEDTVDAATVSESNTEETAAAEDAVTMASDESAESITDAEAFESAGSGESDESGLTSIHIDDLTISEGASGSMTSDMYGRNQYFCYHVPNDTIVAIEYSGKEYEIRYSDLESFMFAKTGSYIFPSFESGQSYTNQWKANNTYAVSVSLGNASCSFHITITESPFVGIEAEDIDVIEGADGYTDGPGRFRYIYSPVVTLTTNTGKKITIQDGNFAYRYNGEDFYIRSSDDQTLINQWEKGPHTATVFVGHLQTDFTVNVVETPVDTIVFNPSLLSLYEERAGIPDYLLNYTVYFKDGTSMDSSGRFMKYKGKTYSSGFYVPEIKAGERKTATVELMGKETTVDVECFAMASIELVESDGLKLRIKRTDGSMDEHKVYYMMREQPIPYWRLFTDKGYFYIAYDYSGDYENMSISILDYKGEEMQKSNQLQNSKWLQTALYTSDFASLQISNDSPILATAMFDGKVTADNIDAISALVFLSEPFQYPDDFVHGSDDEGGYELIDADLMKSKIKERFAVNGDVDMSLSPTFDPSNNTIKVRDKGAKKTSPDYLEVISTEKEQGFWLHSIENGFDAKIVFDDNYKIARINSDEPEPEFIKGDVNGDGTVDAKDLTTLAKHVAKIALITDAGLLKAADVNSDGTVDAKDLTHLAKYVAKIIPEL